MRAPCLTSENQKPRHKAGPGIFLWNFIFIVVVFVYQSTKYTLAKFSNQYKDCEIVRPSHETLKAPLLLCSKPRNKPCIFLSRPQLSLWIPENSRTNRHSACLCAVCAHTQQKPDRNQRQQQQQQKQRSMEWDGDKEEETNLQQHLQQRQRAWIVAPPAYREFPRPESQQQLWTTKTVQRSNGLLHNFLLHIIRHGRLLPLSMLLLPIRVSLAHSSRKCGVGLFLHTSVGRALSLSLFLARSLARVGTGPGW